MKKKLYSITTLLLIAAALSLSSCLKESKYNVNFAASTPLIELPLAAPNAAGGGEFEAEAYPIVSTPTLLPTIVNVASPNPLSTALSVTLGIDTAALSAYNTANSTSYTLLPASDYTVTSWTVTVPANQRVATLNINIITSAIDPSQQYILPISIKSASGQQISNYKTLLYNVQVKNKYDGEYTVTGTMTDVTNAALTGAYPIDADLVTGGATSAYMFSVAFGAPAHDILNGGSAGYYGDFAPQFTFNPTTNVVTSLVNAYGQPAADGRSAILDPTGTSTATGTPGTTGFAFTVKYILVQAGVNRTFFNETWTYVGTR